MIEDIRKSSTEFGPAHKRFHCELNPFVKKLILKHLIFKYRGYGLEDNRLPTFKHLEDSGSSISTTTNLSMRATGRTTCSMDMVDFIILMLFFMKENRRMARLVGEVSTIGYA